MLTCLAAVVNVQVAAADDAALSPAPCHKRSVAGHTAASGQDCLCGTHTFDIFGVSFFADEDYLFALFFPIDGIRSGKDDLACSSARTCRQAFCDWLNGLFNFRDQ